MDTTATCRRDSARPQHQPPLPPSLPIEPLPELPDDVLGQPPIGLRCPAGTPPDGFTFPGAKATKGGWLLPCPCCCHGWVALKPNGTRYGYHIAAELSCTGEKCAPADITWWQAWRCGELVWRDLVEPGTQGRRYFIGACRNAIRRVLAAKDSCQHLAVEVYGLGQLAAGTGIEHEDALQAFLSIAKHTALDPVEVARTAAERMLAGRAKPRSGKGPRR